MQSLAIPGLIICVFTAGLSVGWFTLRFVSKQEFEAVISRLQDSWTKSQSQCQDARAVEISRLEQSISLVAKQADALRVSELSAVQSDVSELKENRREVWAKIDKIENDTTQIKTTNARIETKLDSVIRGRDG